MLELTYKEADDSETTTPYNPSINYNERKYLLDLFNGEMLTDSTGSCEYEEHLGDDPIDQEGYFPITNIKWVFADISQNGFQEYVQEWMNSVEIDDIFYLLDNGIYGSAQTDLIWHSKSYEVLQTYMHEIEEIMEELQDSLGDEPMAIMLRENGFKLHILPVCAFEETVRQQVEALNIGI